MVVRKKEDVKDAGVEKAGDGPAFQAFPPVWLRPAEAGKGGTDQSREGGGETRWVDTFTHFLAYGGMILGLRPLCLLLSVPLRSIGGVGRYRCWLGGLGALLLAGCSSADPGSLQPALLEPVDWDQLAPIADRRPLEDGIWSRKAISYSGFRTGQSPEIGLYPSREEILEDLHLLRENGFGLIRLFSSGVHGRRVVELIAEHQLDLKVQMGAYVSQSHAENETNNRRELDGAVSLANDFPDIVVAVSVGNEVLVSWSFVAVPPEDMVAYIRYVRSQIEQPVTVNDNWEPYAVPTGNPIQAVWGQIDFAAIHTYAYWDSAFNLWDFEQEQVPAEERARAMMDEAYAYARRNFESVRVALDTAGLSIPIVVGETGWQSTPSAFLSEAFVQDFAQSVGHPVNQAWYFADMMAWAYGVDGEEPGDGFSRPAGMFYFAAFDEPWKQADDNWGLWDAERRAKYVLSGQGYRKAEAVYRRASGEDVGEPEEKR